MGVTLSAPVLERYARFSLFNSPYPAHDAGCAIDLYPGTLRDGRTTAAPSPVSGTVLETRAVRAPPKPYAPECDHLLLIECGGDVLSHADDAALVARILHVEPSVEAGDRVDVGDSLGRLVRAGFFAPWVDNHLHVGFRRADQHLHRAMGSLPLDLDVDVEPIPWDGTGTVVATGETYAVLDSPAHPAPGERFVGIEARVESEPCVEYETGVGSETSVGSEASVDDGSAEETASVLDGGIPHYDGGGVHAPANRNSSDAVVSVNGDRLGTVCPDGRTVDWHGVTVLADEEPITGLSLFCARDRDFGAKLICPERSFAVGESVSVRIRRANSE